MKIPELIRPSDYKSGGAFLFKTPERDFGLTDNGIALELKMIEIEGLQFGTEPMAHQLQALHACEGRFEFAFLMEQGTGKTKTLLDRFLNLFLRGKADGLIVVAPNGVHSDWIKKGFSEHWPHHEVPATAAAYRSGMSKRDSAVFELVYSGAPAILAINYEALLTNGGQDALKRFFRKYSSVMIALDESDEIKTPSAKQTKACLRLSSFAAYRYIATGTEINNGALDLFAQFQFLRPGLLGAQTFSAFKARYAEWRERVIASKPGSGQPPRKFQELVRYRNLEELKARVARSSFQVLKKDCLQLPDKIYETRTVVLSKEARAAYEVVRKRVLAEFEFGQLTTTNALTRALRLSQITGGFLPLDPSLDADPELVALRELPNAKIAALKSLIPKLHSGAQVIIWARFVAELRAIHAAVREFGGASRWWGEIPQSTREAEAEEFLSGKRRFMIAQPGAAGRGHTWVNSTYVIYYSNDFSYVKRAQSEDRSHRIGQTNNVTYIDLVAENTIDSHILLALKNKRSVAEFFKDAEAKELFT